MDILRFTLAVLLLELTPGPNMAYLASLALSHGRMAGLAAVLGVALGLTTHAVIAAFGAGAIIQQSVLVYEILRWTGVLYLLYLAWEGWQSDTENSPERTESRVSAGPLFWRGFLTNVFNPKSIFFFVSVVPTFIAIGSDGESALSQMAVLGIVYVVIASGIHTIIVLLASTLRPWIVAGPHQSTIRRVLSVTLALVAFWLAWTTKR